MFSNRALLYIVLLSVGIVGCQVRRAPAPESTRQLKVAAVARIIEQPALSPAVWAPDGRRIAYGSETNVWVAHPDGAARAITPVEVATTLSWSAPLDLLAVIDRGVVWTFRDDGGERTRLDLPGFAVELAWAPGSDRLAVVLRRTVEGVARSELWLVSRDGSFRRMVTRAPAGQAIRDLQWFSDSLYLMYGLSPSSDRVIQQAWRVRIAYPDRREILIAAPVAMLRLAPSGRAIAYLSGSDVEDGRGRIVISRLDGMGRFVVTPDERRYGALAWSPQGDKLAFAEVKDEAHAEIWIADADGSGRLHVYSYGLEFSDPSIMLSIAWSPDGRRLVFGTNSGSFTGPIWIATLERR